MRSRMGIWQLVDVPSNSSMKNEKVVFNDFLELNLNRLNSVGKQKFRKWLANEKWLLI